MSKPILGWDEAARQRNILVLVMCRPVLGWVEATALILGNDEAYCCGKMARGTRCLGRDLFFPCLHAMSPVW